jgi:uncharacterized protein
MTATAEIRLADDLTLPVEAVTETFAMLGKRGTGKTSTAVVLAEELINAGQPVVILDPTGVWHGLRSSADGNSPGLPVVIIGGEHGDLPLHEGSGELLADLAVGERVPMVLDLSLLSKAANRRFATDFLTRLYAKNRQPLHLIVDESDVFAPQRYSNDMTHLVGAMNDIVRRGRVRGIGVTLISQRPAVINKDVLSQTEVLVALRLTGKLDRDAVNAWIDEHADDQEGRELKDTLSSLPVGTAWVWSPGWLSLLRKVQIRRRRTFDSSATPKPGERVVEPRRFAAVDLERLRSRLEANEPVADKSSAPAVASGAEVLRLRQRVATLEAELAGARAEVHTVEVPALGADDYSRLDAVIGALTAAVQPIAAALQAARQPASTAPPSPPREPVPAAAVNGRKPTGGDGKLARAERAILTVLAQHGPRTTVQVALLTGYSHKSGGFRNALSSLRTAGFLTGRGTVEATAEGVAALGDWEPLPQGPALVEWWYGQLGRAERLILAELVQAWPSSVTVNEIAARTGYSATSGGFRNALSRLRSLQLAAGRGELAAAEELASY